jgi:hypothetical protein
MALRSGSAKQTLRVEPRIDRVGTGEEAGVQVPPQSLQPNVVGSSAERAWAVPGSERGRFVEEEQFREPAGLHQRLAMPATELEATPDPATRRMVSPDPAVLVVEAASVAVHESPRGIGNQLAERRDPVPERHRATFVAVPTERRFGSANRCLDGQGQDLASREADGRRQHAEAHHPDPAGHPRGVVEGLDGDVAFLGLGDPEDHPGRSLVNVHPFIHPPTLRERAPPPPGAIRGWRPPGGR